MEIFFPAEFSETQIEAAGYYFLAIKLINRKYSRLTKNFWPSTLELGNHIGLIIPPMGRVNYHVVSFGLGMPSGQIWGMPKSGHF